jgi:hypothetical protein
VNLPCSYYNAVMFSSNCIGMFVPTLWIGDSTLNSYPPVGGLSTLEVRSNYRLLWSMFTIVAPMKKTVSSLSQTCRGCNFPCHSSHFCSCVCGRGGRRPLSWKTAIAGPTLRLHGTILLVTLCRNRKVLVSASLKNRIGFEIGFPYTCSLGLIVL